MRLVDADALEREGWSLHRTFQKDRDTIVYEVKKPSDFPAIEERETGHWERHNTYYGDDVSGSIDPDWRCSECGGQANVNAWCLYDLTDFCPHCGADMRKEGEY